MGTYTVPPGCTGIEMPGGIKADADKQGHVRIDNPILEKYALSSGNADIGAFAKRPEMFRGGETKVCSSCAFTGFGRQETCPRCDSPMVAPDKETT